MHLPVRSPRAAALAAALALGGCSQLVARHNAGIPHLERANAPVRSVATGAKYAGWVLGAPLALVLAPVAALAWATPWVDLPLAVDIASAPALGLGYALQGLVGYPTWGALGWAGEPLGPDAPPDASGEWVPPGFVVAHHAARVPARPARALDPADVARYAAQPEPAAALRAELLRRWSPRAGEVDPAEPLTLPLPPQGPFAASLELYPAGPRDGRPRPLLLITPPTEAAFAARWLGARWARQGINVAVIQPEGYFLDPALSPAEVELKLRGAVVSARNVLLALRELPEVDRTRTAYMGVSAGAIFGSVLVAVEPGISRAALVFPGGDLPGIVCESEEDQVAAWRRTWEEQLGGREPLRAALGAAILTDPQRLAPAVDPARVLVFLGHGDTKVPVARGEALCAALGEPETWRLAGNHDTAALCFGFVLREVDRFLFSDPQRR